MQLFKEDKIGKYLEEGAVQTKNIIVVIPIEEYKDLLIIKGKYEELSKRIGR